MISAFEAYFESLRGKKIVVLGLGVSNRPLVRLLLEFGCDVTGCDRTPRERLEEEVLELERMGCKLSVGDSYLDGLTADVLFRTPGMHPGNPAIVAMKEKGAEMSARFLFGLFALLNSTIYDRYISIVSKSKQINAKEFKTLPLPPRNIIENMGMRLLELRSTDVRVCDSIVNPTLHIKEK